MLSHRLMLTLNVVSLFKMNVRQQHPLQVAQHRDVAHAGGPERDRHRQLERPVGADLGPGCCRTFILNSDTALSVSIKRWLSMGAGI